MSQPHSYRPVMNRNVTRKWAEARQVQVDYDGDDWGADAYHDPTEPSQPALTQSGRSFTNPPAINTTHRLSFDQGPEQRVFSAGAAPPPRSGFPPPAPSASSHFTSSNPGFSMNQSQPRPLEPTGRTSIDSQRASGPVIDMTASAIGARTFPATQSTSSRDPLQPRALDSVGRTSIDSQRRTATMSDMATSTTGTRAYPPTQPNLSQDRVQSKTPEPTGRASIDSQKRTGLFGLLSSAAASAMGTKTAPSAQPTFSRGPTQPRPLESAARRSIDSQNATGPPSNLSTSASGVRGVPSTQSVFPSDHFQTGATESAGRASLDSQGRSGLPTQAVAPPTEARGFSPRKSSLSQSSVPDFTTTQPRAEEKPLPFIRPSDIYRRMDQEREKERRSQDSSRPSLDSLRKDPTQGISTQPTEDFSQRLRQNPDRVPERKNEYGSEGLTNPSSVAQPIARSNSPSQINTNVSQERSFPSASSLYTDRPESVATDSQLPSRNVSQHDSNITSSRPTLPQVARTSTFGADMFRSSLILGDKPATSRQPDQFSQQSISNLSAGQGPSADTPYRNLVDNAFLSENTNMSSLGEADNSLGRSNTNSTSQISPIVARQTEPEWDRNLAQNAQRANDRYTDQMVEDLGAPRRLGTNRRDSPSPARKPESVIAPSISEPQSAVLSPTSPTVSRDTATQAQLIRPGPAILVHQKGASSESVPRVDRSGIAGTSSSKPPLRSQESQISEVSDSSNFRSTSEEWRDWSNQRQEFNAKHGFVDSNPATPGVDSGISSPAPLFESLNKNMSTRTGNAPADTTVALSSGSGLPASARPQVTRDESFRPRLPGGWESSASIQKPGLSESLAMNQPRSDVPNMPTRTDSIESIPTASAPREANWRSQYSGPQGQPFAAAQAAGDALAGIFNGPALTSRGGDSEGSSINEQYDQPTGRNRDSTLFTRDFASSTPPPPVVPDQYATRDFASILTTHETSQPTPKASQQPFASARGSTKSTSSHPRLRHPVGDDGRDTSPSRESERWWSDEEDEDRLAHAPNPLRTKRLSTIESHERSSPVLSHPPRFGSRSQDPEQLESDIMKSLTPKSSSIDTTNKLDLAQGPHLSPTRSNENRAGSPPFSAAALALSPGRNLSALHEQNTFKPLTNPDALSPKRTPGEELRDLTAGNQDIASKSTARTAGLQQTPIVMPQTQPTDSSPSLTDTARSLQDAPRIPQPDRSDDQEGTVMPSIFNTPTIALSTSNREYTPHLGQPSQVGKSRHSATEDDVSESTHSSSRATTERGLPLPLSGSQATAKDRVHDHEQSQEVAVPKPNVLSDAKPSTTQAFSRHEEQQPNTAPTVSESSPRPSTPRSVSHESISAPSPIIPPSGQAPRSTEYDAHRSFPEDKVAIERIFAMGTAQQRIQAYNENREVYSQPVGHLENWLSHMKSDENADLFTAPPRVKADGVTPTSKLRRENSSAPSSTNKIQDDGKKLFASASKYGMKAGSLGKGLLFKGKEKLRTVSASQKGGSTPRKNADKPDYSRSVSATSTNAPQLPTPTASTPIKDSSTFSAYFPAKDNSKPLPRPGAAVSPPFSPISEVSTNQGELGRSTSGVSAQSPQSSVTARPISPVVLASHTPTASRDDNKGTFGGAVSALESERDGRRVSADLLHPTGTVQERANSSVSDVSSVSDSHDNRHTARSTGLPIDHQISRDDGPSVSPLPIRQVSQDAVYSHRPQNDASKSVTATSKEAEASRDRVENQTLATYGHPTQNDGSRMPSGSQIVPIARLRQDHDVKAEGSRPFSFVENDSLLHTRHETNHSIDNPGVNTGSTMPDTRAMGDQQGNLMSGPRANNVPFERNDPVQPSRVLTQAQAEEQYRIPGPYGHELRSPRKTSSPMLEQFKIPVTTQPAIDPFVSGSSPPRAVTSDYTPFPPQQTIQQSSQQAYQPQPRTSSTPPATRPGILKRYSTEQTRYDDSSSFTDSSRDRSRDRGRPSMFSALFGNRSKSGQNHPQKESPRDQRPDNSRRNSLFKLASGRNSMSRENSYGQARDEDYEPATRTTTQTSARPEAGARIPSKDYFGANFQSQADQDPISPIQHGFATAHKRKRFSGLFGKSQTQVPTRASTTPLDSERQSVNDQAYGARQPDTPSRGNNGRHVSFEQSAASREPITSPQSPGFHSQTTVPRGSYEADRPRNENYRRYSNDRNQAPMGPSIPGQAHGPSRQNTGQSDYDPYGNWLLAQKANNEILEQDSLRDNGRYPRPVQTNSSYQHENRPYAQPNANQYQYEPPRPVLPRLNTGDNRSGNNSPVPASAPAVPDSYLQNRQNQIHAPTRTNTQPQNTLQQQYPQVSFPQPPSTSQYSQPPMTRAARDISHNSDVRDRTGPSLLSTSRSNDYNDRQMASPLPMSPSFSESNTLTNPSFSGVGHASGYPRTNESAPSQSMSAYPQQAPAQSMSAYPHPVPSQSMSAYPQQPASRISPHVAQLHVRSRSPKLGRRSSDDLNHEYDTANNGRAFNVPQSMSSASPVAGLGTFNNKKVSPLDGVPRDLTEQEKPWAITLPADEEERRRRVDDPQSATSSRAREAKRMLLEKSPVAEPVANAKDPVAAQTTADRFESHVLPQQSSRTTDRQPLTSSLPGASMLPPTHDHEHQSTLPVSTQLSGPRDVSTDAPLRSARRSSHASEQEVFTPPPAMPGTQRVTSPQPQGRTTPLNVGRPTTPSFSLRRDVSLRGKGPRTSTVIDEAGRTMIISGLTKRSTTPVSIGGPIQGRNSLDIASRHRSPSLTSRDIAQQQHDTTIPGRASMVSPSGRSVESRPPVPVIPNALRDQLTGYSPTMTQQDEFSATRPGSSHAPVVAPTPIGGPAATFNPSSKPFNEPVIPTTTNTFPATNESAALSKYPIIPTTSNTFMTAPMTPSSPSHPNVPIIPTTTNMLTAPTHDKSFPIGSNDRRSNPSLSTAVDTYDESTNDRAFATNADYRGSNPIIPTTTNTMNMPTSDKTVPAANARRDSDTFYPADERLRSPSPVIPTTTNTFMGSANNNPVPIDTKNRGLPPLEVFEMMGSRPEGYESDDEPMMSATTYPGQEWQPAFEAWED